MSRALLIARVAFYLLSTIWLRPRGQPGSILGYFRPLAGFRWLCFVGPLRTLPVVYVSAVIDGGSHPFPFRTRKLSRLSPMVLGLRARESRSLQDSRGPLSKDRGPLRLYRPLALRPGKDAPAGARSRDHDSSIRVACRSRPLPNGEGLLFFTRILRHQSC